jgi:tellurite resistance protein TerC
VDAPLLYPFAQFWWVYAAFTVGVLTVLLVDLGVFHREPHAVGYRESLAWSAVWIALALAFNYGLYLHASQSFGPTVGREVGLEFLTGFLIEKALAVDNVFVFVLVFRYFAIPLEYQHRVLFYGIIGALVFRALFIALGSVLMQYSVVVLLFGGLLIASGLKMLLAPRQGIDPGRNPVVRAFGRLMPTTGLRGQAFVVTLGGVRHATPLFVALLFIELSDVIFAIDSVPAIFAITDEPLVVYTSNVCAILGLRAMYFLLAGAVDRFHLLHYGLAVVLIFVGLKMTWLNDAFGGKFPVEWSLGIIAAILTVAIVGSLAIRPQPATTGRATG